MKIAIATDNNKVSEHFGRCPNYTLFTIEENKVVETVMLDNPGHEPGKIPAFLKEQGASVIIAGGMGARAQALFNESGIKVIIGVSGEINVVIEKYIKNELLAGPSTCSEGGGRGYGIAKTVCDH
jgi:predicted Fe-Mo cluster-binding NifX family protein